MMARGLGFVLGVLLVALSVFTLSGKGGQMLQPIMASVRLPFEETRIPSVQRDPENKKKEDESVSSNEVPPALDEVKDKTDVLKKVKQPHPMTADRFVTAPEGLDTPQSLQPRQYKLWSPFHSRHAAQGFADRIAEVAGVSVDIQRTGPARFQVSLLYRNEPERLASIERIERLTGLKIQ